MVKATPEFVHIVDQFASNLRTVFPEHEAAIQRVWPAEGSRDKRGRLLKRNPEYIYNHCKTVYPPRFFQILYKNAAVFDESVQFFPGVDFREVWAVTDISDETREKIWEYMQMILVFVVDDVKNPAAFGAGAQGMFGAIPEEEMRARMEEIMNNMVHLFEGGEDDEEGKGEGFDLSFLEGIMSHITKLMDGKLGTLAKGIIRDIALEEGVPEDQIEAHFATYMRDKDKMAAMFKRAQEKLEASIAAGEIDRSELLNEGKQFLEEMQKGGAIPEVMRAMGLGKKSKVNYNAMQSKLDEQIRLEKQKERLRRGLEKTNRELEERRAAEAAKNAQPAMTPEQLFEFWDKPVPAAQKKGGFGGSKKGKK